MDNSKPLVSISCITYNHVNYIQDAIEGFLMQKTTFPIEILIHDDASTDGTEEIIREYEAKYPNIIKPLYEKENQWVKGRRGSVVFNFPRARGKYIALCEGDDYWTDPYKLQKQVDFLEANPEYGLVHTNNYILYNSTGKITNSSNKKKDYIDGKVFEKILTGELAITTCTVLVRNSILKSLPDEEIINNPDNKQGDLPIWLSLSRFSKVKYLNEFTAVYRINEGSVSKPVSKYDQIAFQESSKRIRKEFADKYKVSESTRQKVNDMYYTAILNKAYMLNDKVLFMQYFNKLIKKNLKVYLKNIGVHFWFINIILLQINNFIRLIRKAIKLFKKELI